MIAKWVAVLLLATPAGIAGAQQPSTQTKPQQDQQQQSQTQDRKQPDPLAAAAKRAREQQKSQPPTGKVWDNDNLPSSADSISVVGKSTATAQTAAGTSAPAAKAESQPAEKSTTGTDAARTELEKELAQAKAHLKSVQTDLDIATRTYQLDQQMFYGKPDYASDTKGAAKLKAEESDIQAKKQEVDDLQKNVDGLTAKLKEVESQSANPEKTPQ